MEADLKSAMYGIKSRAGFDTTQTERKV